MTSDTGRVVPPRIRKRLREWQWLHRIWWALHYGIGILGVVAASVTTMGEKSPLNVVYIGITAAVSTSLITFLGPLSKAQRYWLAFHETDQACYEFEEGHIDSRTLGAALKNARNILTIGATPAESSIAPQSRAARDNILPTTT